MPEFHKVWKHFKRTIIGVIVTGVLLIVAYFILKPDPIQRTEIFRGVFLTVEEAPAAEHGSGRIMIVEVHWDTPGVVIQNRPFSYPVNQDDQQSPHYRLTNADWALLTGNASLLMNTTRYHPDELTHSVPGKPVRSIETVIADGTVSHVHQHSYLMYMDRDGNAFQLFSKPPDPASLASAVWAIGIQGIQVSEGKARPQAMGNLDDRIARSFIGLDPERKILYLIAFEDADGRLMMDESIKAGVTVGGQVDSGGGTTLLIGSGAAGILPHTGIRGWRPLGGYLTIHAEPLDR